MAEHNEVHMSDQRREIVLRALVGAVAGSERGRSWAFSKFRSIGRIAMIIICCELASACTDDDPTVASPFDGIYVGDMRAVAGNGSNPACSKSPASTATGDAKIVIANGRIEYHHFANDANHFSGFLKIRARVQQNGSFSGSAFNLNSDTVQTLKGQVFDNRIEAATSNSYCKYNMTLERQ